MEESETSLHLTHDGSKLKQTIAEIHTVHVLLSKVDTRDFTVRARAHIASLRTTHPP